MVKEYICFEICSTGEETQAKLNKLASKRWKLVCSYAYRAQWLIMEREKKQKR